MKLFRAVFGEEWATRATALLGMAGLSLLVVDCFDSRSEIAVSDAGVNPLASEVLVDFAAERAVVAPHAFGMHASVYDNALGDPELPALLHEAGITLLRYPGGGYSDNYHWSTHAMSPWSDGRTGYLGPGTDFGSVAGVVERFGGAMMITVNYGSNLQGTGPGEPKEAAAWVAYANGDPDDPSEHVIGVDGAGNDWQTVGYWASLRASEPLEEDDGRNFLRIARPEPLGVEYWEIGNEVFGNGYNERGDGIGFEHDLHLPYDAGPRPDAEALSGTSYGTNLLDYIEEMKAVDPTIKIGAALGTPPADYAAWNARRWNRQVLEACGEHIDFAIVHFYPAVQSQDRMGQLVNAPQRTIPTMVRLLRESFVEFAGDNAAHIELTMTEVGPGPPPREQPFLPTELQALGLFALDTYVTLMEHDFRNIDWLELHNGSFLSERSDAKGHAFHGIRMAHLLASPGDALVSATSTNPGIVAHASRRRDGRFGVLLINTSYPPDPAAVPPPEPPAPIEVELTGADVPSAGERYDFFPMSDGTLGSVEGPTRFSDLGSPFRVTVPPWGATVLLFGEAG